jgi:hypothetical protein
VDLLVRQDLGSVRWTQYVAAIMALEFCSSFHLSGHRVEFVKRTRQYSADARTDLVGRWITVEFKSLHDHDKEELWYALMGWVNEQLLKSNTDCSGLEVDCTPAALSKREELVDGILNVKTNRITEYQELPQETGRARFVDGNMGRWIFPLNRAPEINRLINRLRGKYRKQLEEVNEPTLVVVRTSMLFKASIESIVSSVESLTERIRPVLSSLKKISAVLLYDDPFLPPLAPASIWNPNDRLLIGSKNGCARVALLVPNINALLPLTKDEMALLIGPSMIW